jgi:hypothetical protein
MLYVRTHTRHDDAHDGISVGLPETNLRQSSQLEESGLTPIGAAIPTAKHQLARKIPIAAKKSKSRFLTECYRAMGLSNS